MNTTTATKTTAATPASPVTPMTPMTRWKPQPRHAVLALAYVASAVLGWKVGWGFGDAMGGAWVSVMAAANGALFCTLLADAAASRLLGRRRNGPPRR